MPVTETTIEPTAESDGCRSNWPRIRHPFAAVVGQRAAKHALLLLAIEPGLQGAVIGSPGGSQESALARAFGSLLQTRSGDRLGALADPSGDSDSDTAVVELPLNTTEDSLLGGLDLERTIATGKRQASAGLLARANGRLLYASDINLLDSGVAAHLARALDSHHVRVERDGLSAVHDADFIFVGTYDSDEGEPGALLRDRVGLIVDSPAESSADEKTEIVDRALRFDKDPFGFADEFAFETAQLRADVADARARLPRVRVSKNQLRQISRIAVRLGVEGNRADIFALKAARANAALSGRDAVNEDDLAAAIRLVLAPRATTLPSPPEETEDPNESLQPDSAEENSHPENESGAGDSIPGGVEDIIIQAIEARAPEDLLSPGQRANRGSRNGKRFKASPATRGRYVRSATNRICDARIAIDATLRAAAPFQLTRRLRSELTRSQSSDGDALRESGERPLAPRIKIEPGDLRFKEFRHRSGILFIFAVDASGSMALNRMAQAKGALTRLLQQSYLHRDQVALISFRGASSEVLLAPTRSVELAKRLVDAIPAGGGTPLSAGLVKAIDLARLAGLRGLSQAVLVLFTDGRANVGLGDVRAGRKAMTVGEELTQLGVLLGSEGITPVVVDTKSRFVATGEGEALARTLGARYFYLPRSGAEAVYDAIKSAIGRPRES